MGKARLLVVEDDNDISNMLKIYFSGLGYDVDVAPRGAEALSEERRLTQCRTIGRSRSTALLLSRAW